MAKVQTRRTISIRGATYALVAADCATRDLSMSDYIEQIIADDHVRRGRPVPPPSPRTAAPLPSESSIKVGPPAAQQKLPMPAPRLSGPSDDDLAELEQDLDEPPAPPPKRSTTGLRMALGGQSPRPEEVIARRARAHRAPPPISAGVDDASRSGRAAAAPAPVASSTIGRAARNVVLW